MHPHPPQKSSLHHTMHVDLLTSLPRPFPHNALRRDIRVCIRLRSGARNVPCMRPSSTPDILPEAPDKTPSLNMDESAHHISLSSVSFLFSSVSLNSDAKLRAAASVCLNNSTAKRWMRTLRSSERWEVRVRRQMKKDARGVIHRVSREHGFATQQKGGVNV